jgi:hypothetical protein
MANELICPYTGLSVDERIDDICQYSCVMQSECPLGYDSIAQDFDNDDN